MKTVFLKISPQLFALVEGDRHKPEIKFVLISLPIIPMTNQPFHPLIVLQSTVQIESVTPFRKAGKVLGTITRFSAVGINTHHCNTCGSSQFALLTSMRSFQPDLSVAVCDRCGETENLPDSLRSAAQSVLDTLNGGGASHE